MKLKVGLVICFCIGLIVIFQLDRLYYHNAIIVKPITTTQVNSVFCAPWSIKVTNSLKTVELIVESTDYFDLAEVDSDNKTHIYTPKNEDGLYIIDTKVKLNSRYTSFYNNVYYFLESSNSFTYDEEKFGPRGELIFMIGLNIVLLILLILILALFIPKDDQNPKSRY